MFAYAQVSANLFDFVRSLLNNHHFPTQGCLPKVRTLLLDHLPIILVVLTNMLTLEVVVVILAVCLCLLQNHMKDVLTHQVVLSRGQKGRRMADTRGMGIVIRIGIMKMVTNEL